MEIILLSSSNTYPAKTHGQYERVAVFVFPRWMACNQSPPSQWKRLSGKCAQATCSLRALTNLVFYNLSKLPYGLNLSSLVQDCAMMGPGLPGVFLGPRALSLVSSPDLESMYELLR